LLCYIGQRKSRGLVRQRDIRAAATLGKEATHRRDEILGCRVDRSVVQLDAELRANASWICGERL
jgi:hypothetical protein